jgi:ABC-type molybdate transport system substrate-binding protein
VRTATPDNDLHFIWLARDINIYPLSEIIPNTKLKNLGAVIPELQVPVVIEATLGRNAADPKAARALIAYLQGPAIDQALKDDGMEKGRVGCAQATACSAPRAN